MAKSTRKSQDKNSGNTRKPNNTVKRDNTRNEAIRRDVILSIVIAFCIVLFLSDIGLGGTVGYAVSGFLFGIFGLFSFALPFIIVFAVFFFVSNSESNVVIKKTVPGIIFLLFFCCLCELFVHNEYIENPLSAYTYSSVYHVGGGIIGGAIGMLLVKGFGLIGAYVITVFALLASMVLLFNRSISRFFISFSRDRARKIRNRREVERIKEEKAYNTEKRAREKAGIDEESEIPLKRRDRHASGVSMNTAILPQNEAEDPSKDDISELSLEVKDVDRIKLSSGYGNMTTGTVNIKEEPVISDAEPETGSERVAPPAEKPVKQSVKPVIHGAAKAEEVLAGEDNRAVEDSRAGHDSVAGGGNGAADSFDASADDSFDGAGSTADVSVDSRVNKLKEASEEAFSPETPNQDKEKEKKYVFPSVKFLKEVKNKSGANTEAELQKTADKLEQTLANFGVNVKVTEVSCGPAVTRFEIQPEMGVKVSRIVNLADDIKLNLAAPDIRIEAPIPGKAAVGIEVPNKEAAVVSFREMVESDEFKNNKSKISFGAGKDLGGKVIISDIAKMPHVLIAGATGSGKSVCINTIIMSILFHARPDEVKFIMIDPKVVELSVYNGIPHLLAPVVTDPKKAAGALNWAVKEMDDRYQKFAQIGVRNMEEYNQRAVNGIPIKDETGEEKTIYMEKMPQVVVIVDELADLMMVASGDVEQSICRLAQLARAAGIHLVIATQRPSVNVITGLIKANMPSRIAFAVTSGVDSRTILDMVGAEKLLGKGDMLYYPQGVPKPLRVQGAFVSDDEVHSVVDFLKKNNEEQSYDPEIEKGFVAPESSDGSVAIGGDSDSEGRDMYFKDAGRLILEKEKASIGMLQRNFKIGFNRAARIMDQLEEAGVVGPEEGTKPRRVLMSLEEFEDL